MEDKKELKTLLLPTKEAAKILGVSAGLLRTFHNNGRLGPLPIRLGKHALWNRNELEAWVAAQCPARRQWQELKKIKQAIRA